MISFFKKSSNYYFAVEHSKSLKDKEIKNLSWLLSNATLIREKKLSEIYSQLQMGAQYGMNTLEQCLNDLYAQGLISKEEALGKASNPKAIKIAERIVFFILISLSCI